MPTAPPHPCAHPGCPALVSGAARCPTHARAHTRADAQRRGTAAQRGYSYRWQQARARYLANNPLCRPCSKKAPPHVTLATVVDHVTDHKGDPVLFWDQRNWQPSCAPCHDARTDAGDFGRPPPPPPWPPQR
jgi:5-methylcytosine-specific restriction protein A